MDAANANADADADVERTEPPTEASFARPRRRGWAWPRLAGRPLAWSRVLATLALGQLLSLVITGSGVTSELLAKDAGVSLPATQNMLVYVSLALVYPLALVVQGRRKAAPPFWREAWFRRSWWKYGLLAFVDIQANYIVVLAYRYTSITSIMLLDCFAIPVVMIGSRWLFGRRYHLIQLAGVAVCLVGLCLLVVTDVITGRNNPHASDPVLGDLLCLLGATLYGVSNVSEEYLVKHNGRLEFLAMLGLIAAPISLLQSGLLEGQQWSHVAWSGATVGLLLGFAACLFCLYSLVPYFLIIAGATPLNLSLLSSDFYGLLFGIFLFGFQIHPLYMVAFIAILSGVIAYERFSTTEAPAVEPVAVVEGIILDSPSSDNALLELSDVDEDVPALFPANEDTISLQPRRS